MLNAELSNAFASAVAGIPWCIAYTLPHIMHRQGKNGSLGCLQAPQKCKYAHKIRNYICLLAPCLPKATTAVPNHFVNTSRHYSPVQTANHKFLQRIARSCRPLVRSCECANMNTVQSTKPICRPIYCLHFDRQRTLCRFGIGASSATKYVSHGNTLLAFTAGCTL